MYILFAKERKVPKKSCTANLLSFRGKILELQLYIPAYRNFNNLLGLNCSFTTRCPLLNSILLLNGILRSRKKSLTLNLSLLSHFRLSIRTQKTCIHPRKTVTLLEHPKP